MHNRCLHCDRALEDKFCPNCGQKASTHRYSLKHFLLHDVVHSVLHLDKGFFYTLRELFTRPGHSIREYVQGKRAKHFNFFTFIFLVISIGHFIGGFADVKQNNIMSYVSESKDILTEFEKVSKANPKLFILIQIPFVALFSLLFFRKSKQNYTEHLILNTYKASAEILIMIAVSLIATLFKGSGTADSLYQTGAVLSLAYAVWFYYQYFSGFGYSKIGLFFRSLLTALFIALLIAFINSFILGFKAGFEDAR